MDVKNRMHFIILISILLTCLSGCSKSQNLYNKMETVKSKETALNADNQNTAQNTDKKDINKKDTDKKDTVKKDTDKKDTVKKDTDKKDTVKKESKKKDTDKEDSNKKNNVNKDSEKKKTTKKNTVKTNDNLIKQSKEYFSPEDIYINNKPVLNVSYEQLLQEFGKPLKQEIYEVSLPASEEIEYLYVCVYEGFTCEFFPKEEKCDLVASDSVFRFDITDENVKLDCGLQIGMTIEEIEELYGKRDVYLLDSSDDGGNFYDIEGVLEGYKPKDYYVGYNDAMIIYHDTEKFEDPIAKALVLLINHGRLDRIVFNYPTAG